MEAVADYPQLSVPHPGLTEAHGTRRAPSLCLEGVGGVCLLSIRIETVELDGRTVLAPLAGVTDRSFRTLCREQGASLAVTEMVCARRLADGSEESSAHLDFETDETPISVQVFGSDPDEMAAGAEAIAKREPDLIDINCGCPVKKIVNRNAGAALMREPEQLGRIVRAMKGAVSIPITVKIRSGWDCSRHCSCSERPPSPCTDDRASRSSKARPTGM